MSTWTFEVISKESQKVLIRDTGFVSESEAEYYANLDAKIQNVTNYYIRTFPDKG